MKFIRFFKWVIYTAGFLLVSVFEFTPHMIPPIDHAAPLLLIPLLICTSMFEGETAGAMFGVLAGLIWDTQGGKVFGFDALFLLIFGLCAGLLVEYLFRNTIVSALIFTLSFTFLLEVLTWFFFRSLFGINNFVYSLLHVILPTSLYTLVFTVPFYYCVRALSGRFKKKEAREHE